uniref:protein-glutamine gamma-glutamyltransferase n=1 Tax=Castor canadensis TaxID=51338 RepID=A0A8C0ZUU6_CASCN
MQRKLQSSSDILSGCRWRGIWEPWVDRIHFCRGQLLLVNVLLQALRVDLLRQENTKAHRTDTFQTNKLVVRRGQVFHLRLMLNRPLGAKQQLKLKFTVGRGAHLVLCFTQITVAITSAPNAIVGQYNLIVKSGIHTFKADDNFYLLFNPWCPEDLVFLSSEEERAEYILNDTGYIYMGFFKHIRGKPWNFGQFEKNILSCSIFLLGESYLKMTEMRDPVLVARTMCAMVSSANRKGVLTGNWSGNYSGGTAPTDWTSSVSILQEYYRTKKSVNYGQCWVFSGILTTVLRALGIPARSVTAFESAHDTEKNLTVDIYLNEMGKTISSMTKDSVWNFHVWTDAWMKRPDLPQGNDGWQALDGTPQEISQGIFRCGPSPLSAIRKGNVFLGYDTKFIFTEVNGDKLIWLVRGATGDEKFTIIAVETGSIGKNISTKAVGQDRRHDITYQYKYPEGSSEEREAMNHAHSFLSFENFHKFAPVDFAHLSIREDTVQLGKPIIITLVIERKISVSQHITVRASMDLQTYTGRDVAHLGTLDTKIYAEKKGRFQNQGQEMPKVVFTLDPEKYINSLGVVDDEVVIKAFVIVENKSTEELKGIEATLCFLYPDFTIEMPDTGRLGQELPCICIFKNSLTIPLTDIRFSVESLGMEMGSWELTLQPNMTLQFQIKCIPVKTGPRKFIIKFTSKQVKEIHAEKVVLITK